ncbi:STYKc [Musa troglodytarum]|uniref:STYKc n=1 Tax=Musa troglodytarum TaxID=320322 RepID=A0A9E7HHT3_9LILI|nr:STYKc [Musa troglodytarum]
MPNGSLQEALFGSSSPLNWDRRFSIILDVAQALAFLHLQCDPPVVHGDIKPSNVLLGFDFQAKISDFGLSQMKADANLGADFFSQDLGLSQELFKSQAETFSFEHGKESRATPPLDEGRTESSDQLGKRWWWKQDGSGELSSKDYVREWIGSQICPSSNSDRDDGRRTPPEKCFEFRNSRRVEHSDVGDEGLFGGADERNPEKKQGRKKGVLPCDRKMREWWKEEYFAEMSKNDLGDGRDLTADAGFGRGWRKKRSQSAGSDMFSGDLLSRELSSTTSMRGTVCYVAPECHHGCDQLMEKADMYSFGVLILVIVSGRRPLHVLPSPAKPEKASLVSWCRRLLQAGNLLELVDERLKDAYDKEQASLCINLALLCLQRIPELRPDGGDVVRILKGEMELPAVPCELSPSPPARHHGRSRRKASMDEE